MGVARDTDISPRHTQLFVGNEDQRRENCRSWHLSVSHNVAALVILKRLPGSPVKSPVLSLQWIMSLIGLGAKDYSG